MAPIQSKKKLLSVESELMILKALALTKGFSKEIGYLWFDWRDKNELQTAIVV